MQRDYTAVIVFTMNLQPHLIRTVSLVEFLFRIFNRSTGRSVSRLVTFSQHDSLVVGTVASWLDGLELNPQFRTCGLSVLSLHVLLMFAWVFSCVLPQDKDACFGYLQAQASIASSQ